MPLIGDQQRAPVLRVVRGAAARGPVGADREEPIDVGDLDALYRRYAPYVGAVATRLLGRDSEVDDLVQDVFLSALRGLTQLRDAHAVRGWLAKVTVRQAVRKLRKRRILQALQRSGDIDYQQLAAADTSAEQKALLARIYRALDQLPARTRVIWILRHVVHEPLHSIVDLTSCSQSTVQRKLRDAESHLARELEHA
jgi:RNA polymerase sigma-70 factor, ECF subfamily